MTTTRSIRKDEKAVSPVVAVIMLIAITVIIAAVVAAFAYGIIGGVNKAPNIAFVVDGADEGATVFYVIHHGGEEVNDAYDLPTAGVITEWKNLLVKVDGIDVDESAVVVGGDDDTAFEAGEMLEVTVTALTKDQTISVVYVPTDALMQRVKVN